MICSRVHKCGVGVWRYSLSVCTTVQGHPQMLGDQRRQDSVKMAVTIESRASFEHQSIEKGIKAQNCSASPRWPPNSSLDHKPWTFYSPFKENCSLFQHSSAGLQCALLIFLTPSLKTKFKIKPLAIPEVSTWTRKAITSQTVLKMHSLRPKHTESGRSMICEGRSEMLRED